MTTSTYEERARIRKAVRIMDVLRETGCTLADARNLDAEGRRRACEAAGVHAASDATWETVFGVMEREEHWRCDAHGKPGPKDGPCPPWHEVA